MTYLYDGTFEGFLTAIYKHYYNQKAERIVIEGAYQVGLLEEYERVVTDKEKAAKVQKALEEKLSSEALHHIHHAFLSFEEFKDTQLLHYIEFGFKQGKSLDDLHGDPRVLPVHKMSRRVGFERHRFLGLLRFQQVENILYAEFEPDNDIITLLADHFADRLKQEKFIIHDKKRHQAIVYSDGFWYVTDFTLNQKLTLTNKEKEWQELWKGYFNQVAIKERKNLKLQQQFVPKKYRRNITEFK